MGFLCTTETSSGLYIRMPLSLGPGLYQLPRISVPRTRVHSHVNATVDNGSSEAYTAK
jgi:hypothetical protein